MEEKNKEKQAINKYKETLYEKQKEENLRLSEEIKKDIEDINESVYSSSTSIL